VTDWKQAGSASRGVPLQHSYLSERELWLVRLRWFAVAGVVLAVLVATRFSWIHDARPLLGVAAAMALYNTFFWKHARSLAEIEDRDEQSLLLQIAFDLTALTLLIHWSGGIENPFAMFFAFHMAIAAMLMPFRSVVQLGVLATVLYGGLLTLECVGVLPHNSLVLVTEASAGGEFVFEPWRSGPLVTGYVFAFAMMLFGVIYFVRSVEEQRWRAEDKARSRERLAQTHERMARIGEISSGVAHTLRNPLHGVMNCLDILRQRAEPSTNGDGTDGEVVDLMSEGLRRIQTVTERLLLITREEHSERKVTDVGALVQESLRFLEEKARTEGVRLSLNLAELPPVALDANRLGEAVTNIVDNAIFACRGGGRVTIRTAILEEDPYWMFIEIEDTGTGIPPETLEHIFDPFFTTKGVGEGSGLGLAIVTRVLEDHGGRVEVESVPGEGSRFRLYLPLEAQPVEA
jgi:signal transduction histidine kinase